MTEAIERLKRAREKHLRTQLILDEELDEFLADRGWKRLHEDSFSFCKDDTIAAPRTAWDIELGIDGWAVFAAVDAVLEEKR